MANKTNDTPNMSYEWQAEARVWIDMGRVETGSPLKLTISQAARLYRLLGAVLRDYSAKATDVLTALGDEADENETS